VIKPFWKKFALIYFAVFMVQISFVLFYLVTDYNGDLMPPVLVVLYAPLLFIGIEVIPALANFFAPKYGIDVMVLLGIIGYFINCAIYAFAIMGLRALWLIYKSHRATTNY